LTLWNDIGVSSARRQARDLDVRTCDMRFETTRRRVSFMILSIAPLAAIVAAAIRPLRIPGVYQSLGAVLFTAIVATAWVLGLHSMKAGTTGQQRLALAGGCLVAPFALVALLWVGLSTPQDATPPENEMRYLVLVIMSIAITSGFAVLWHALTDAGEGLYSTVGFAANMLAGAAYVFWLSFALGASVERSRAGQMSPTVVSMAGGFDSLEAVACLLTYFTTAAFAVSLARAHWLGRGAMRAYAAVNIVALLFLMMTMRSSPDPRAPWYLQPVWIVRIPAIPWVMPFLLGVVLLRRAGDQQS
jgi:hypothetical protein